MVGSGKKALEDEASDQDWKEFVQAEELSATVDFPSALFWRKLMILYPSAKVLLTDRDPVDWYHSVKSTIYSSSKLLWTPPYSITIALFSRLLMLSSNLKVPVSAGFKSVGEFDRGMFGAVEDGEKAAVAFYEAWKAEVVSAVPEDRLLIFQVNQGWEPLCKFLGLEIPSRPFPRMNDSKEVKRMTWMTKMICHVIWIQVALIIYYIIQ